MAKDRKDRVIDRPFGQARRASSTISGAGAQTVGDHHHDDRYYRKDQTDAEIDAALAAQDLNDLADVDLVTTPPTAGQALIYDSASDTWKSGTVSAGDLTEAFMRSWMGF